MVGVVEAVGKVEAVGEVEVAEEARAVGALEALETTPHRAPKSLTILH